MLAARGYCVIAIDSRGSQNRGLLFESHIKGRMGTVELNDQVEVLKWLADSLNYIDLNRVAIYGWSYGNIIVFNKARIMCDWPRNRREGAWRCVSNI